MTKTKTIKLTLYRFSELSEKAKDHARQEHACRSGYCRETEAMESIHALAKHFGGKMAKWEIDWWAGTYSSAQFEMPDEYDNPNDPDCPDMDRVEIHRKLLELGDYDPITLKGHGESKLTGWFFDDEAIDGFRQKFLSEGGGFSETGSSLEECMQAAFESWLKACQDDCEDQYSDETFSEHCDANEIWFTKSGKTYQDTEEGPFYNFYDALAFAEAEVGMPWRLKRTDRGWIVEVDDPDGTGENVASKAK